MQLGPPPAAPAGAGPDRGDPARGRRRDRQTKSPLSALSPPHDRHYQRTARRRAIMKARETRLFVVVVLALVEFTASCDLGEDKRRQAANALACVRDPRLANGS